MSDEDIPRVGTAGSENIQCKLQTSIVVSQAYLHRHNPDRSQASVKKKGWCGGRCRDRGLGTQHEPSTA